jgi:hypothetical protein
MATRLYLSSSALPAFAPAFGAAWALSSGHDRRTLSPTKASSPLADLAITATTTASVQTNLTRQFVSEPLAPQTIAGTLIGVVRGLENNAGLNGTVAVAVRLVDGVTGAHKSDLVALTASDATTTPPEFGTAAATRRLQNAAEATTLALTSQDAAAGDRLVVELGFRKANTSAGRVGTLRFGEAAATDFAHADGLTTDLNPWVELSATLVFAQAYAEANRAVALVTALTAASGIAAGEARTVPATAAVPECGATVAGTAVPPAVAAVATVLQTAALIRGELGRALAVAGAVPPATVGQTLVEAVAVAVPAWAAVQTEAGWLYEEPPAVVGLEHTVLIRADVASLVETLPVTSVANAVTAVEALGAFDESGLGLGAAVHLVAAEVLVLVELAAAPIPATSTAVLAAVEQRFLAEETGLATQGGVGLALLEETYLEEGLALLTVAQTVTITEEVLIPAEADAVAIVAGTSVVIDDAMFHEEALPVPLVMVATPSAVQAMFSEDLGLAIGAEVESVGEAGFAYADADVAVAVINLSVVREEVYLADESQLVPLLVAARTVVEDVRSWLDPHRPVDIENTDGALGGGGGGGMFSDELGAVVAMSNLVGSASHFDSGGNVVPPTSRPAWPPMGYVNGSPLLPSRPRAGLQQLDRRTANSPAYLDHPRSILRRRGLINPWRGS